MSLSLYTTQIPNGLFHDSSRSALKHLSIGTESPLEPKCRNRMFVLGLGFVGQFFGQQLKNQGWDVSGTCTSIVKKKKLEDLGFDVYHFDTTNDPEWGILNILKCHTHLLVSIPPLQGIGDPILHHEELLKRGLVDGDLQWLGYFSTTSVYGNCSGQWVDEDYPANPTSESAKHRLALEKRWLNMGNCLGIPAHVFRLGGIYGPGRSAVDTIIKQEALSAGQRRRASKLYTSRIHVDDICQALVATFCSSFAGKVYNIVDDDPAPREEVFEYARKLIEKKWPCLIKQSTSQDDALIATAEKVCSPSEKRVSNARMKQQLGVRLIHPSYRTGLQSIIDQMNNPYHFDS